MPNSCISPCVMHNAILTITKECISLAKMLVLGICMCVLHILKSNVFAFIKLFDKAIDSSAFVLTCAYFLHCLWLFFFFFTALLFYGSQIEDLKKVLYVTQFWLKKKNCQEDSQAKCWMNASNVLAHKLAGNAIRPWMGLEPLLSLHLPSISLSVSSVDA